ncbi:MAG TPA: DegT/DnrJ/EryC1/StrS family aminotransferase [Rhizomicrobium sp.]|nr:DegT/DnrJ/EryC1/StrS family aminotransferase [Rhizomicrobium sp.]
MSERLALRGGPKVRSEPLPVWPPHDPAVLEGLGQAYRDGPRERPLKGAFEKLFAAFCGAPFAIAVSSGTAALDLAVRAALARRPGAVMASCYGHPASIQMAARLSAVVLVDIDPSTLSLSLDAVSRVLAGQQISAVVTTHVAGALGRVGDLAALCRAHEVTLIEDASHAHASVAGERKAGTFGDIGCFSLHATKNLSAGEGGMIVTASQVLVEQLWRMHDLGRDPAAPPYAFRALEGNLRMSEFSAAAAMVGLSRLLADEAQRGGAVAALRHGLDEDDPLALLPCDLQPVETRRSYHFLPCIYRPEKAQGLSRRRFVLALCAEGLACSEGWPDLLTSLVAGSADDMPAATAVKEQSVWIDQRVLLSDGGADQLLRAVRKIRDNAKSIGAR